MKEKIKKMIRHRFGRWTIGHDRSTGFYVICNHYKGSIWVEDSGLAGAGDVIIYPRGCRNLEYIYC